MTGSWLIGVQLSQESDISLSTAPIWCLNRSSLDVCSKVVWRSLSISAENGKIDHRSFEWNIYLYQGRKLNSRQDILFISLTFFVFAFQVNIPWLTSGLRFQLSSGAQSQAGDGHFKEVALDVGAADRTAHVQWGLTAVHKLSEIGVLEIITLMNKTRKFPINLKFIFQYFFGFNFFHLVRFLTDTFELWNFPIFSRSCSFPVSNNFLYDNNRWLRLRQIQLH